MNVSVLSIIFLVYCILRALLAILSELHSKEKKLHPVPLVNAYVRGINDTALSTLLAVLVAVAGRMPVFGVNQIDGKTVLSGLALLILMLTLSPLEWRFTPEKYKKRIANFAPRKTKEQMLWIVCSIAAGVGEEIIFRSVLLQILLGWTGNYWDSAIISAVIFALTHIRHGWLAVVEIFFIAVGLHWLVKISGGLYISIGVHFLHNLIYGIIGGILIKPMPDEELARDQVLGSRKDGSSTTILP